MTGAKLVDQAPFMPDAKKEVDKLLIVEHCLSEGGLIDRHLRWAKQNMTPSAAISPGDYGYLPTRYTVEVDEIDTGTLRPEKEPIDYQLIATNTLGLDYDTAYPLLAQEINAVDGSWYKFLIDHQLLVKEQVDAMIAAATTAYRLGTLTEDNLPTYVVRLFSSFMTPAILGRISTPATEEWTAGIWSSEENAHKMSMNDHGKITGMTADALQIAGRNSQLRAGMDVELLSIIHTVVYVAWQELSTNYAHKHNGDVLGPVGNNLMQEVSTDEALHHRLYQSVLEVLFEQFPDDTIRVARDVLLRRFMPGSKGIPRFARKTASIHNSGIFSLAHSYDAARVVVRKLGILVPGEVDDSIKTEQGRKALEDLRAEFSTPPEPRKLRGDFILGQTIDVAKIREARKTYKESLGLPARKLIFRNTNTQDERLKHAKIKR